MTTNGLKGSQASHDYVEGWTLLANKDVNVIMWLVAQRGGIQNKVSLFRNNHVMSRNSSTMVLDTNIPLSNF